MLHPVLLVVVPLLAAPVCVLAPRLVVARWVAVAAASSSFAVALVLLQRVREGGVISEHLGGWAPPFGIEYRVTVLNAFVAVLVSGIGAVVLLSEWGRFGLRLPEHRRPFYFAAFLLCLAGLLGMAVTGDAFNVFVFLEISSLASYSLISLGRDRRALMAAFSYLIVGTIGGTFVLIGIGMLYQMTGTLNIMDLAARLPPVLDTRTVKIGFGFLVVGLSIKLAVFPMHQWLPNAYTYAPPKVSAFLAGTATKVSYYLLLMVLFVIFGASYVFDVLHLNRLFVPLSLAAMFVGSFAAIYQDDLRRLLAYSSIAQVGYMTLAMSYANESGLTGGVLHMFNHGLTKSALFLVAAAVLERCGTCSISALGGFGRRMPLVGMTFVVGGLSLIGVPGTAGFVSKWFFIVGALERGWLWVAVAILLSSLLAVVYVWRVVEVAYFGEPDAAVEAPTLDWRTRAASLLLTAAIVLFGVWPTWTVDTAKAAARFLLAGGV